MTKHIFYIVREDFRYYQIVFISITIPLIIFMLMAVADVKIMTKLVFIDKYFWSITIGVGAYMLVYGMNMNRIKESRDRLIGTFPITLKARTTAKVITGILPILIIWSYLELLKQFLSPDWSVYAERVNAQLGLLTILLGVISILFEYTKMGMNTKSYIMSLNVFLIFVVIISLSAGLIYIVALGYLPRLPVGGDELYFYLWGLTLIIISMFVFYRRESYVV